MALGVMPGTIAALKRNATGSHKVQVHDIKRLGSEESPRYRVALSDGAETIQSMLLAQLNTLVKTSQLKENTVIEIKNYKLSDLRGKPIVIVLDCAVVAQLDHRITAAAASSSSSSSSSSTAHAAAAAAVPVTAGGGSSYAMARGAVAAAPSIPHISVAELSPYQNSWTIKVRVTKKTPIKHFHARTEGKLFSAELIDDSATEIRATFFNEAVDKAFELIHEGGTYYMSGGRVKTANRKFTSIANDYEIQFGERVNVMVAPDDGSILAIKFNFVQLHLLPQIEAGKVVDVLGIVREEGNFAEITTRRGTQLSKRDLQIVDESNTAVTLTLWGDHADKISGVVDQPIAVKGAKVGDYGGVSLSTSLGATVQVNPGLESAKRLQKWWEANKSTDITMLTSSGPGSGGGSGALTHPTKRKTLAAIDGEGLAHTDDGKGSMMVNKSTVVRFMVSPQKDSPPAYMACSTEVPAAAGGNRTCNKKMTWDEGTGIWTCERCHMAGKPCNSGRWRWILNVRIADHSGAKLVTAFDEDATTLLGEAANESITKYINMSGAKPDGTSGNGDQAAAWFAEIHARELTSKYLTLKAKVDTYNDEQRVRITIARVRDIDPLVEAKRLLDVINATA